MSSVSRSDEVGRVEHVVLGCPGDLGFKVIATSAPIASEERQALMGLSDQGSGAMLASEAITVANLGTRFAILVTNPDETPGTRAGLVVTHAFLVSQKDYGLVGFDPFTLLAPVRGSCGALPPKRAELAHPIRGGNVARVDRLRALPLEPGVAAAVAPAVAAALLDSAAPTAVPAAVGLLAAEVAIGLMSIDRRRSFTFATADFSGEATKLDLVGSLESVRQKQRTTLLVEIEWLLTQGAPSVASVAERLSKRWPHGAGENELMTWLSTRRELSELEREENWKKVLRGVESLARSWDGDDAELAAAGRLLGRALTLDGTFQPKGSKRVIGLLDADARAELTAGLLEAADEYFREVGPADALRGRALLAGWAGARRMSPDVSSPFLRDLDACLDQGGPAIAGLLAAVMESAAPIPRDRLEAIEWFAWRHSDRALRRMAAGRIEDAVVDPADLARSRRGLLLDLVKAGRPEWVESWFEDRGELLTAELLVTLDALVKDAYPGAARERAVELVLCGLGVPRDASQPPEAIPALKVIRRLLGAGERHQPGTPVARAVELLDGWLPRSSQSPAVRAQGLASADRVEQPERQSRTRWWWPFRRSLRDKGPACRPRPQHAGGQSAGDRWMFVLLLVLTVAVAVALLVKLSGSGLL